MAPLDLRFSLVSRRDRGASTGGFGAPNFSELLMRAYELFGCVVFMATYPTSTRSFSSLVRFSSSSFLPRWTVNESFTCPEPHGKSTHAILAAETTNLGVYGRAVRRPGYRGGGNKCLLEINS
eukprot:1392944-Amorphochlora_amoeboformis.AAC.2